ncbi:LamB/YcsF family protein [Lentibacter sp. XHP0401]|jgi:5-oxoprolinase (ATP-hydrolysing) subunit A|uniref:LamB/YcsF family protein n=1 Tax=Lentibacter sp. XHP0401 TaxID=2984334 RepID=UPI0021E9362F|nr:5-oxoprolinase subunit PxpA [Lentibacter sp. XHP0401]MCV2894837.1 LamB/YcsF family protein [Lentibacter sp. XHP0401]
MVMKVDLNSDMGEGFGPWRMGDDAALLDVITSANIACGFHAGDPDVMAQTMRLAAKNGVGIGAHPGFADLKGFGRRRLNIGAEELGNLIAYQFGAAEGMARSVGAGVRHFKLHGALANMCAEDATLAKTCYEAALRVNPEIILMVLAQTAQQSAAESLGANWAGEIFADRAYEDDATLVDRSKKGAVLHDADVAAERILNMLREDAIIAESGKRIAAKIDTICLHGDTPEAVDMARALRTKLSAAGVTLAMF